MSRRVLAGSASRLRRSLSRRVIKGARRRAAEECSLERSRRNVLWGNSGDEGSALMSSSLRGGGIIFKNSCKRAVKRAVIRHLQVTLIPAQSALPSSSEQLSECLGALLARPNCGFSITTCRRASHDQAIRAHLGNLPVATGAQSSPR